ncbi:MAG: PAS domain S-box protein, partial [Rhodospirillales bacterium]|nr:PAS domain S-box protein [Acetobacter sp.]
MAFAAGLAGNLHQTVVMPAPLPCAELDRLRALMSCELLDTRAAPEFDQITALAAETFGVPVALITLVDAERQWFKSSHGLDVTETPRDQAFCAHTILDHQPLIVPDAQLDPRFTDNPLVTGAPHIRFYAGAPLTTHEGHNLGALCLIDFAPRSFSEADAARLTRLAGIAMTAVQAHRITQELRTTERRFQRITEHAPGLVYQFLRRADGSGYFPFVSGACREILELEPEVLRQDAEAYFRLVPAEERAARDAVVAESLATLQPLRWEGRHVLPSGRNKYLQISARPERRSDGDVFWDGIMLDVTERRQTEERLWMLESSVENANDAIIITEAEPVDEPGPRIIYANRAFTKMSGHSVASVIGKTPRMFQGPKTDPETKATIRRALKRWKPVRVEILNYRKDGSEFWVELNIVPVANDRGWYTHWVSVQRDVTERKAVERALEGARDEAQRANAAKSEFL